MLSSTSGSSLAQSTTAPSLSTLAAGLTSKPGGGGIGGLSLLGGQSTASVATSGVTTQSTIAGTASTTTGLRGQDRVGGSGSGATNV